MENNLDRTLKEIKLVFKQINKHMFANRLPEPVLVVQSSKRTKMNALGWFSFGKEWVNKETGERFHEITVCAETLLKPLNQILGVLVHEMVHLYNKINGIDDCSKTQYHNKHFKKTAETFLLEVNQKPDATYGYAFTKPTQKLIELFE
ncbi:MAG: SprT-like domain-containing protein, partial [Firmicutes bacterium]|nr:SprT-like domain-containing protein [Bacillota bacterium]